MTIDDAPMDELDLAIRREAAALRAEVRASADTDSAWDDFGIARSATVISLESVVASRRRWRIAAAVGMVAALIVAVVVVREVRDNDRTKLPVISPSPTTVVEPTESDYSSVVLRRRASHLNLFAIGSDGTERQLTKRSFEPRDTIVFDVSSTGWVAQSGFVSEGFWFFHLRDPEGTRRFVSLAGPPSGSTSRGTWSPDGTQYASIELGETAVVIEPVTGTVTRLPSATPPFSYPPTWTADGKGLLAGPTPNTCFTGDEIDTSTLRIIPVDGGPESSTIPALDGAMNRLLFGPWTNDDCRFPAEAGTQQVASNVVVDDPSGKTTWIDSTDLAPSSLISSSLGTDGRTLWVLAERNEDSRVFDLYAVSSPHQPRLANTLDGRIEPGSTISIAAVAPDESAVVVATRSSEITSDYYLVPTDGSPPFLLDGDFSGFVLQSLPDEPQARAAQYATLSLGTDTGLTALGPGDTKRTIAGVPGSPADSYLHLDVSSAGWVAETGIVSNGFWFYDLRDPAGTRQFVGIRGAAGGQMSRGTWSPDGTRYATVENGATLAIVDPATGVVTRLPSDHPPIGRQPTWTADGSGILAGDTAPPYVADGSTAARALTIIPIDGGPEITSIPPLADGMNHVTTGGLWSNDNERDGSVVLVGPNGAARWLEQSDVDELRESVFARTRRSLWVIAEQEQPGRRLMHLYEAFAPHSVNMVNTIRLDVAGESVVSIVAVAPDDSGVVVAVDGPGNVREFRLVPTDGSASTLLDGEFAGFVPMSLVDSLGS